MEFDTWEKPMLPCHARFLSAKLPNVNTKRSSWAIQPGFQTTSVDSFAASVKGYLGHHWGNSKFEKGLGAQNRKKTGKPTELAPSPACYACYVHMDAWGIGSNSPDISWMLLKGLFDCPCSKRFRLNDGIVLFSNHSFYHRSWRGLVSCSYGKVIVSVIW